MADGKITVKDANGASQNIDQEIVTTTAGAGLNRQRVVAPETDALLAGTLSVGVIGTVPVSGTLAATQSGTWTTAVTGTLAATQSGSWTTGRTWTLSSATDSVTTVPSGTQAISGSVSISGTVPISAASLPLPSGASQDGVDGTGITAPTGGSGIRGWLSGIYSKLSGTLATSRTWTLASGSDSVTTVPSGTQTVSGTVTANAGTGTMAVSAASLPLPAGASTAAKQPAIGSAGTAATDVMTVQGIAGGTPQPVSGTFWQATQPVSGTFWQATQPVSLASLPALAAGSAVIGHVIVDTAPTTAITAASLPLPTGAATAAKQPAIGTAGSAATDVLTIQGIASGTPIPISGSITATNPSVSTTGSAIPASATLIGISDGTNLKAGLADLQGGLISSGAGKESTFTFTTVSSGTAIDCMNLRHVSVHILTQGGSSTVNFEGSNDNSSFAAVALINAGNLGLSVPVTSSTAANVIFHGPIGFRYFRLRVSGIASGSTTGVIEMFANSTSLPTSSSGFQTSQVTQSGTWTVQQGSTPSATPWAVTEAATSGGWTYTNIASNTTTTVKSGSGRLRAIVINSAGTTDTATVYDNTAGSGTKIATINTAAGPLVLPYDLQFSTGLTIVTAGTTAADITVIWK